MQKKLDSKEYAGVLASLADVQIASAADLFGTYAWRASDLAPALLGAPINGDLNLRLQYLTGWA